MSRGILRTDPRNLARFSAENYGPYRSQMTVCLILKCT